MHDKEVGRVLARSKDKVSLVIRYRAGGGPSWWATLSGLYKSIYLCVCLQYMLQHIAYPDETRGKKEMFQGE